MSLNLKPRTERRFGVTADLSPGAVARLYSLRISETWEDLLDVMEQVCIEVESKLINTAPENSDEVLANHKMTKAAWMLFVHMQERVDASLNTYLSSVAIQPEGRIFTDEEREREMILNPLALTTLQPEEDAFGPA
jgi:hypothetical protein